MSERPIQLIILDRDGVINRDSPHYIRAPSDWHPLPGSLEAIARLTQGDYHLAVATNQSGIARGYYTREILAEIHEKMHGFVHAAGGALQLVSYCPHGPAEGCACRKPAPGLLLDSMAHFGVSPQHTLMIGDSWRDIAAAESAGCQYALVKTGNGKDRLKHPEAATWIQKGVLVFDNLMDVVERHPSLQ